MKKQLYRINNFRIIAISLLVLTVGIISWFVFSKQVAPDPTTTVSPSDKVIMVVKYVGGLCRDGKICSTEYKLFEDGRFEGHKKLSPKDLNRFNQAVSKSDLQSYKTNPNPKCPSFYDGQDEVLIFPQRYQDQAFTVCRLEIPNNDVVISTVHDLIKSHQLR